MNPKIRGAVAIAVLAFLAGCSQPQADASRTEEITATLLSDATDYYGPGATFEFQGRIFDQPGARLEIGVYSLDSELVASNGPVVAEPDAADPSSHGFAGLTATLRGEPGLQRFWVWYAAYDGDDVIPSRSSKKVFFMGGDADSAEFLGSKRPADTETSLTGTIGGPQGTTDMLQVQPTGNYTRYSATLRNELSFPLSGWLFGSFYDHNGTDHDLSIHEPMQIQTFNLEPGQQVQGLFMRPAWDDRSTLASDQIVALFEPKYGVEAISHFIALERGENGRPRPSEP